MLLDFIDRKMDDILVVFSHHALPDHVRHRPAQVCKCLWGSDDDKLLDIVGHADRLELFGDHGTKPIFFQLVKVSLPEAAAMAAAGGTTRPICSLSTGRGIARCLDHLLDLQSELESGSGISQQYRLTRIRDKHPRV